MKITPCSLSRLLIFLAAALLAGMAIAQEKAGAKTKAKPPKLGGTYLSGTQQMPPLPYHPFPKLPTVSLGGGQFRYDDSRVDYQALRQAAAEQASKENNQQLPAALFRYSSGGDLQLSAPVFNAGQVEFTILNAATNSIYDLFVCTNFPSSNAWAMAARTPRGQTNLSIPQPAGALLVFQLGTMQDSDADTLSDAFENLVSHTDPLVADTAASAGTNAWLADLLTERPAVLDLLSYHQLTRSESLWDPCFMTSTDTKITIDWTNDIGGIWTKLTRHGTCNDGLSAHYTNYQEEAYWQADDSACYRARVDEGAWTLCAAHPDDGMPQAPRNAPNIFQRTTNYYLIEVSQTVTNKVTGNAEARTRFRTGGTPRSANEYVYEITATVTAILPGGTSNVPPALITVLGLQLDTNGHAYKVLSDNTTNDVTPRATNFNHYGYTVQLTKLKIPLDFRNSGMLTSLDTNGIGYNNPQHFNITNEFGTNLGASGFNATIKEFFNLEETDGTIPKSPALATGWEWHRDRAAMRFAWKPGDPAVNLFYFRPFSNAPPGPGNDSGGGAPDSTPDLNGLVVTADAPNLDITLQAFANTPVGTVGALRFTAREWLTWNGTVASDILKWHSYITIKKTFDDGTTQVWIRVGKNEIGSGEELQFFELQEAQGL